MKNKITQSYIDKDRRGFIEKVVGGSIAGSLMLMIPMSSDLFGKVLGKDPNEVGIDTSKNYTFMIDVTACIGCGSCCIADRKENNVPDGQYRTWVERYVIDIYNTVYVDAPDGGEKGYSKPRTDIENTIKDAFLYQNFVICVNMLLVLKFVQLLRHLLLLMVL